MFAGFDGQHDFVVGQHGGNRHDTASQRLAENKYIGTHPFVVAGQHPSRTADSGLHFVGHEEYIMRMAKVAGPA